MSSGDISQYSENVDVDTEAKDAADGTDVEDDQLKSVKSAFLAESRDNSSATIFVGDNSKSSTKNTTDSSSNADFKAFSHLTDIEFLEMMYEEEQTARHLAIENEMFTRFLQENDPYSMEDIENLYTAALNLKSQISRSRSSTIKESKSSITAGASITYIASGKSRSESVSNANILQMLSSKGVKINLNTKTEMCVRAIEDKEAAMEAFKKKTHATRRRLKCELEEFVLRENDISDAMSSFEYNIVIHAVDPLTQRIPAEKFLNYMSAWLKASMQNIEKLRLRSSSMRLQYSKVSALLLQRQELRINVQAVDFDRLEIENKHFQKKIDQKNDHLFQLKKMSAGINLVITKHKKYMQSQVLYFSKVRDNIKRIDKYTEEINTDTERVAKELEKAEERYEYFKALKSCYRVPEVMEYVNLKSDLREIHKEIKIWQRKKYIQDLAMDAAVREMKHLTGSKCIQKSWLRDPDEGFGYNLNSTESLPDFTTFCLKE